MRVPTKINHRGLISHFTAIKKKETQPFSLWAIYFSNIMAFFIFSPLSFWKLLETSAAWRNKASTFRIRCVRLSSSPSTFYS